MHKNIFQLLDLGYRRLTLFNSAMMYIGNNCKLVGVTSPLVLVVCVNLNAYKTSIATFINASRASDKDDWSDRSTAAKFLQNISNLGKILSYIIINETKSLYIQ